MEQKTKFIIAGLVALLASSLFIALQINGTKQAVERERDSLKQDNVSLAAKAEETQRNSRRIEEKFNSLNKDLERITQEKEELSKKYELVGKEREELIQKLKSAPAVREISRPPVTAAPPAVAEDSYWAGVLKAKTDLELQLESIRNELKSAQINSEQLEREKSNSELEMNSLSRENQELKRQMEYNQKIMDSISQELVREKNDKFQIEDALKSIKGENTILRRQMVSLSGRKVNLEKKILDIQKDRQSLERRLTEMETLLKEQSSKVIGLKGQLDVLHSSAKIDDLLQEEKSVELPPIVVRPQPAEPEDAVIETRPLSGKVIAVNKENNFVVIDLGEDKGISEGNAFKVYRQDNLIGEIEVTQLRKSIAACDIKKQTTAIQVGDIIR